MVHGSPGLARDLIRVHETALRILADRRGLASAASGDHSVERARAEAGRLLATHQVEPLLPETEQEIEAALAAHDARCRGTLARA
jgi:hypothetical protein